jgi:hypothetical protein
MKINIIWLIAAVLLVVLWAQPNPTEPPAIQWQRTFFGKFPGSQETDIASSGTWVELTSDGGFIVAGITQTTADDTGIGVYLVKTDSLGNLEWERVYQAWLNVRKFCVRQTPDGGYILAGTAYGLFPNEYGEQPYLIKTDSAGVIQWHRLFLVDSLELGFCVSQTTDEGYIVSGINPCHDTGLCVFKTDSIGNLQWQKSYDMGYGWTTYFVPIAPTNDGGYIIGTRSLWKIDSFGNTQWVRNYNQHQTKSVLQTSDGNYIAAGTKEYGEYLDSIGIFLFKANQSGNIIWWQNLHQNYPVAQGIDVQQTNDGGYVGAFTSGPFYKDTSYGAVIRTDSGGVVRWIKMLPSCSGARCIRQTSDGGFIVTGYWDDNVLPMRLSLWKLTPESKKK